MSQKTLEEYLVSHVPSNTKQQQKLTRVLSTQKMQMTAESVFE